MKKTLIALAVLGASTGIAYAASSVTLYGVVDTSAVVTKTQGHAEILQTTTASHLGERANNDTLIQMKSGFRNGSRWGIKGIEDLGNGYSVGFILEDGFDSTTGGVANGGGAFSRESKLFVQGDFGQIGFGRLGSLAGGAQSNSLLTGWALGTSYTTGSWTNLAKGNGRLNNAIAYVSPSFAGFKFSAEYSNGVSNDDNKWSDNTHYYGIGVQYTYGGFTNSLIFEAVDNDGASATTYYTNNGTYKVLNTNTAYLINLGLGYKFGAVTPMFAYQYNWQKDGIKDNVFGLSAAIEVGGGVAKVGTRYLFGKNDASDLLGNGEDKRRAWTINAAYEYPLSKRTTVWGYAGFATGSKTLGKRYLSHRDATSANYNGYQLALGMTHNF